MSHQLRVNPIACTGHGACAELLSEIVELDPWGYPILIFPTVPPALVPHARRAAVTCPALALILERHGADGPGTPQQDMRRPSAVHPTRRRSSR
jgi:ferredoxin